MHQTCASDSFNLPGPKHIKKVCLERHLSEGEVAGVGEPPAVSDNNGGDGIRHSRAALVSVVQAVEGRGLDCRHPSTALCPNSAPATAGHSAEETGEMGIGCAPATRQCPPPHQRIHHEQHCITGLPDHPAPALLPRPGTLRLPSLWRHEETSP